MCGYKHGSDMCQTSGMDRKRICSRVTKTGVLPFFRLSASVMLLFLMFFQYAGFTPAIAEADKISTRYDQSAIAYVNLLDLSGIAIDDTAELKELLKQHNNLVKVNLEGCGLTLPQMKDLRINFPKIEFFWSLSLYSITVSSQDIAIDLGRKRITNVAEFMDFLDCFPNLQKVDMYNSWIKRKDLEALYVCYPNIRFGWTLHIYEHTVRTDVTAFSTLHNNRCQTHSSEDFEQLKYCRDLVALDLGHNCIEDISFLRNFPKLKVLILACNYISDISVLTELKDLEYVELFKNRITDVSALANHEKLLDLNICFNKINDVSMLSTDKNLERFWMYHNKLTDEQCLAMRSALPYCKVDFKSYSTLGGWREHPRYFVIKDIFKTRIYKPFDNAK
jgi:Leucine-rich repeat (LRR) protein